MSRSRIATIAAMLIAAVALAWMAPVGAHTALLEASPQRDSTAGGTIDFVDLAFLDPVSEAVITVTFNGQPVAGVTSSAEGELVSFELDQPLQEPGRYQVSYEMISFDSDFTTSGFFFTYATDAPQPARLGDPDAGSEESSQVAILATVAGITALLCVAAVFVWRIEGKRRAQLVDAADDDWYD